MTNPAKDKPATTADKPATTTDKGTDSGTTTSETDAADDDRFDPRNPNDSLVVSDKRIREMGVEYQRAGQVRAALGQLRNARGQDNATLVRDAEKRLAALGFDLVAHERGQRQSPAGDKSVDARRQPPEGRSASPAGQVTTDAPTTPTASPSSTGTGTSAQATPAKAASTSSPPVAPPPVAPAPAAPAPAGVTAKADPPKSK